MSRTNYTAAIAKNITSVIHTTYTSFKVSNLLVAHMKSSQSRFSEMMPPKSSKFHHPSYLMLVEILKFGSQKQAEDISGKN